MLALARPSVNEVWPLAANQNHRFNRPANDNNITSGLCTRTKYAYDGRNRLASSLGAGITTTYGINGLGQRVRKTWQGTPASTILFVYDDARRHIGTYDPAGATVEETVFLGDIPVAVMIGGVNYYVYADHLNAPRVVTNAANQTRWDWTQADPFARTLPNQNPSGLGTFNWRRGFPGQFYDAEKSSWHNGFRDYHPALGRYLQSDPIGLAGGDFSTFGYVGGMPTMATDPSGLIIRTPGATERFSKNYNGARQYLMNNSPLMRLIFDRLENSSNIYNILDNPLGMIGTNSNQYMDISKFNKEDVGGGNIFCASSHAIICYYDFSVQSAALGLAHELAHAFRKDLGILTNEQFDDSLSGIANSIWWGNPEEAGAFVLENAVATELGEPIRRNHNSWFYFRAGSPVDRPNPIAQFFE